MATGYSRTPKLLKGALVQFSAPMIVPIPNIIIFQYNPELVSRTLAAYDPQSTTGQTEDWKKAAVATSVRAQPFDPVETFTLSLQLDASDALEVPEFHPVAVLAGVADRLAALELLMYPSEDAAASLLASVSISLGSGGASADAAASVGGKKEDIPAAKSPVVLFVWGPGRIVPVRITSFSVEEQLNNPMLYPLRAKVNLGLQVVNPTAFGTNPDTTEKIVIACYKFTRTQKKVLALANLANSVESILGMLPF